LTASGGGEASSANRPLTAASSGWPAGLPFPLTPFIGRQRELAEVAGLLTASRLVTLTGAGGVGKTRLAVEVAAVACADDGSGFGDGAGFADLSAVLDPALLPGAVARSVGIEERAGADLPERLVRVLRGQRRLLVIDNCEHLRAACADLVTSVLSHCPGVTVLATSRASLGVPGEVTWRVPSLSFPWPENPPAAEQLEGFEAVALFLARARAARPGLAVGPDDTLAVTSICYRLDGIPLALELAAARAGAMSLAEIAARLTGCMELLAAPGAGPARHQTLRASVEWSHQLLSRPERAVFRRLAVFAGGCTLEAAEAVCAQPDSQVPVGQPEVAGLLASLVDRSLVQADHTPAGSRYRLFEVIRAFAAEQLDAAGELEAARERHASYYTEFTEVAKEQVFGPRLAEWARRLDPETGNLRAARAWCRQDPARSAVGLRLAAAAFGYWQIYGRLSEAADWLQTELAAVGGPEEARGLALTGLGLLYCLFGDPGRGRDTFRAGIECLQRTTDRHDEGRTWSRLGQALAMCGDTDGALAACDRAIALGRETGDSWVEAAALWGRGFALALAREPGRARPAAEAAVEMFGLTADPRLRAYAQLTVGDCLTQEGRAGEAVAVLREAIEVLESFPDRWAVLRGVCQLAEACAADGDWPRAGMVLGVVETLTERTGGRPHGFSRLDLHAVTARTCAALGAAWEATRSAGRVLGRGDQITAALWPRAAGDASGDSGRTGRDGLPLTPREREIAGLIAAGLTNRQIGARLFIAERTVDTHVQRILAKLGCDRRAQVAALVTAVGTGTKPSGEAPG
jgi:predicted ATPase/DNA-binding CsgD family transcriptional regulator